jgi:gamma-glutamylcyclotransferase (GGCT)/AIG2-like uncharacterized protein YtfP
MLESKIFVYGTLMNDFKNYNIYLKNKAISVTRAYIYGELYHLQMHDCPAIIEGKDKVYGQVITFVDDDAHSVLKQIDELEKYFFNSNKIIYVRTKVDVYYLNNTIEKLSFYKFINKDLLVSEKAVYIDSGDWKEYKNDKRAYSIL